MIETLGWVATLVFVASYFFSRPGRLRAVQMGGAVLWIVYGFLIGALPVIAANVLVFAAAAWTLGQQWRRQNSSEPPSSVVADHNAALAPSTRN